MLSANIVWVWAGAVVFIYAALNVKKYFDRRALAAKNGCLPPPSLPQKDPILGLDVALTMFKSYEGGSRSKQFKEQHETYGNTFQSMFLGYKRIFTIDPENLKTILSKNFDDWGVQTIRLQPAEPMLGAGVTNTDGQHWKFSRNLIIPLFQKKQISDLSAFDVHAERALAKIPGDGTMIDLHHLFSMLVLDFTTEFLFGFEVGTLTDSPDPNALHFLEQFNNGQGDIGKHMQLQFLNYFPRNKIFNKQCADVRNFIDGHIDKVAEQRKNGQAKQSSKYILLDELLQQTDDRKLIRAQSLNIFLAAHDTTAVLMSNVFFHLARHPDIYEKLRQQLLDLGDDYNSDDLKKCQYLQKCMDEAMRLTPILGQTARIAQRDTILPRGGGPDGKAPILVKKGTSVQFNFFTLHHRPEVYGKDYDVFRPDRWDEIQPGTWDFLPFSAGPRVCPGKDLALLQARFMIAKVMRKFPKIENRDPVHEFHEEYRISAHNKNGCKVAFFEEKA